MSRDVPAHEYERTRGVFDLNRRPRPAFVTMNPQIFRVALGLSLASLLAGCVDPYGRPNYTGSGALVGAGSGALLGAAIDRRNPGAGALIGGAAGLLTGSLIGHGMDEDARRRAAQPPTYTVTTTTTTPIDYGAGGYGGGGSGGLRPVEAAGGGGGTTVSVGSTVLAVA